MKAKAKKAIIIAAIAVIAAAIILCAALIPLFSEKGDISGYSETAQNYYDRELPKFKTASDGKFKTVQLSDTHFTTGKTKKDKEILSFIDEIITEQKPDLVVIAGDMIDDGDKGIFNKKQALDIIASLFENHKQYWAYIPGNNDGINYGTSADTAAYLSQFEHCMVANERELTGGAQYSLDIYNSDNKLVHSMLFLDTNDYDDEDSEHIYGYLHGDQISWADRVLSEKQAAAPDVKTSFFIHENTPAFAEAASRGTALGGDYSPVTPSDEKYNIPKNEPLDGVIRQHGCTGLVSMGHKHPQKNECSILDGIYYHVTAKAPTAASVITIDTTASTPEKYYSFTYLSVK